MKASASVKDSSTVGIHESNDSRRRTCTQDDADRQRQAMADQLFDLAAPAVEGPVVARLVPLTQRTSYGADAELQPVELRDDSGVVKLGRGRQLQPPCRIDYVPRLSAIHCLLHIHPITKEVIIEDTSTNGCYLNGRRITKYTPVTMHDGDNIWLTQPRSHETVDEAKDAASKRNRMCDRHALCNEPSVAYRLECTRANEVRERSFICAACAKLCTTPVDTLSCKDKLCHACIQTYKAADTNQCSYCQTVVNAKNLQKVVQESTMKQPNMTNKTGDSSDVNNNEGVKDDTSLLVYNADGAGQKRRASEELNIQTKRQCYEARPSINQPPLFKRRQAAGNVFKLFETYAFIIPPKDTTSNSIKRAQRLDTQETLGVPYLLCYSCKRAFMQNNLSSTTNQFCKICARTFCPSCATPRAKIKGITESQHTSQNFDRLKNYVFEKIPELLFDGNSVEQHYFSKVIINLHKNSQAMWQLCLKQLKRKTVSIFPAKSEKLTKSTRVCKSCAEQLFSVFCSDYCAHQASNNKTIANQERPQCKQGERCRQQFTSLKHAVRYSHI